MRDQTTPYDKPYLVPQEQQGKREAYLRGVADTEAQHSELVSAAYIAWEHLDELEETWRRGVISENDGKGGTRSNRNVEVARRLSAALKAVAGTGDAASHRDSGG